MTVGARAALLAETVGAGTEAFVTGALDEDAEGTVIADLLVDSAGFTRAGSACVGVSREHAAHENNDMQTATE